MLVNKTLENKDGSIVFQGELSPEEVDVVIGAGLNWLLQQGLLPFTMKDAPDNDGTIQ